MDQRSTSRSTDPHSAEVGGTDGETLVVGEIRGPHGVRGEVRVDPRTDVPDRFAPGAVLLCDDVGPLTVETVRGELGQPIVRFEGINSREAAERLKDRLLRVTREHSRARIAPGSFLWADLVGIAVETPDGLRLGTVRDLLRAGGADILIVDGDGAELLLPMIEGVVRSVDLVERRIVAVPQEELK
ncbi:MAG: 16S rRNA processing protein RimM [Chloroflexi bacterium]|nr:MAG: 16S rRNA processing protein RimM [Chloroflexota bacterium]TME37676.1 MAG: 16S rRNA processing protein RimM [Chloroflexota bacterium]